MMVQGTSGGSVDPDPDLDLCLSWLGEQGAMPQ